MTEEGWCGNQHGDRNPFFWLVVFPFLLADTKRRSMSCQRGLFEHKSVGGMDPFCLCEPRLAVNLADPHLFICCEQTSPVRTRLDNETCLAPATSNGHAHSERQRYLFSAGDKIFHEFPVWCKGCVYTKPRAARSLPRKVAARGSASPPPPRRLRALSPVARNGCYVFCGVRGSRKEGRRYMKSRRSEG